MRRGRRVAGDRVVLYFAPGSEGAGPAFVAGRKVGGAVHRNRARRILREAWRAVAPSVQEGWDIVFVALDSVRGARAQELNAEMTELLRRGGLIAP